MKRNAFILSLLLGVAQAQTTPPVPTAVPATPAPTSTPAPETPAPTTSPAPAAPLFNLTAPVGSAVELLTTTTSRTTLTDVQVSRAPGSRATDAQLNEVRRSIAQGTSTPTSTTLSGKAFYRVTGRDASGTTLVSTVLQNVPATTAQKAQTIDLKYTQVIAPDGRVSRMTVQSSNPTVQAIFASLPPEKLQQMMTQNGSNAATQYGRPLDPGQPHTVNLQFDAQDLMSSVLSTVAGPQAQSLFGQVQATPMRITTTTTYKGLDAQGRHLFSSDSAYGDWQVDVTSRDPKFPMQISMNLLDSRMNTTSAYQPGGLPASADMHILMKMKMTMTVEGVQVSMTMNMEQTVSMRPR